MQQNHRPQLPSTDRSPAWRNFMEQINLTETYWEQASNAVAADTGMLKPPFTSAKTKTETKTPITFTICAKDIHKGNVGSTINRILDFTTSDHDALRLQARIIFKLEDPTIPTSPSLLAQKRIFFAVMLNEQWNYWLHYMAPDPQNIELLLLIICHSITQQGDQLIISNSASGVSPALRKLHQAMAILHASIGLDPTVTRVAYHSMIRLLRHRT